MNISDEYHDGMIEMHFVYVWRKEDNYLECNFAFVFKQEAFWCEKDGFALNWKNNLIAALRQSNGFDKESQ